MNHPTTDEQPFIEIPVDDVLEALGHGDNWIQAKREDDEGGKCLHQGIRECQPRKGDAALIEEVANVHGWGPEWQDGDGVTFDDIEQRIVEHREVFPREMEATFGPNWQQVAAFVRMIAEADADTLDHLDKLGRFVPDIPFWTSSATRASGAAYLATRSTIPHALKVARALAMSPFVGTLGIEQARIDAVLAPAIEVFGPVDTWDQA